jgi:hypothetical protein
MKAVTAAIMPDACTWIGGRQRTDLVWTKDSEFVLRRLS